MPRNPLACPTCGSAQHVVGVEVRGVYDGVLYWVCTADRVSWNRWPKGHYLHAKAEQELSRF